MRETENKEATSRITVVEGQSYTVMSLCDEMSAGQQEGDTACFSCEGYITSPCSC